MKKHHINTIPTTRKSHTDQGFMNFALLELRDVDLPPTVKGDVMPPTYEECVQAHTQAEVEYASSAMDRYTQVGYAVEAFILSMLNGHVVQGNTMAQQLRGMRKQAQVQAKGRAQVRVPTYKQVEQAMCLALDNNNEQDAEFCMWLAEGLTTS